MVMDIIWLVYDLKNKQQFIHIKINACKWNINVNKLTDQKN